MFVSAELNTLSRAGSRNLKWGGGGGVLRATLQVKGGFRGVFI